MTSATVMLILIAFYFIIACMAALESNWWRALYFFAGALITVAALGMSNDA